MVFLATVLGLSLSMSVAISGAQASTRSNAPLEMATPDNAASELRCLEAFALFPDLAVFHIHDESDQSRPEQVGSIHHVYGKRPGLETARRQ